MQQISTRWAVPILVLLLLLTPALGANDPGHDSLYVLKLGESNVTGTINISENLTATIVQATSRFFGPNLDLRGDGSSSAASNQLIGTNTHLELSTTGELILNKAVTGGWVYIGWPGTTTGLNVTGQILQQGVTVCLSNGTNCPAAISGANLTGSGSANYVSKWTSASMLGPSQIYDSGTGIGIGTPTPTNQLTVIGDINATANLYENGNRVCTAANGQCSPLGGSGNITGYGTSGAIAKFTSDGNITSSSVLSESGSTLTINGNISMASTSFWIGNAASATNASTTALGANAIANADSSTVLGPGAKATINASSSIAIGPGALAGASSSVVIGDQAKVSTYQGTQGTAVGGSADASTTNGGGAAFGYAASTQGSTGSATAIGANAKAPGLQATALGNHATAAGDQSTAVGQLANASFQYSVAIGYQATATATNQLVIGNLTQNLNTQVFGTLNTTSAIRQNNVAVCLTDGTNCAFAHTGNGWLNSSNGNITLVNANGNVSLNTLYIDNTNNRVGIKNTSPDIALMISGGSISQVGNEMSTWYSQNGVGQETDLAHNAYYNGAWKTRYNDNATKLRMSSGNIYFDKATNVSAGSTATFTTLATIANTGSFSINTNNVFTADAVNSKVGIDTPTPDVTLHIKGGAISQVSNEMSTWLANNAAGGETDWAHNAYYNSGWKYRTTDYATTIQSINGNLTIQTATSGTAGNAVTWNTKLTLTNAGNLGIGTTTPSENLSVKGNLSTTKDAFLATSTGSVGIGTSTPAAKLDVNGTNTSTTVRITTNSNSTGLLWDTAALELVNTNVSNNQAWSNTNYLRIDFSSVNTSGTVKPMASIAGIFKNHTNETTGYNGQLAFFTTGAGTLTERLRIDENGNMGIATTAPTNTLDIKAGANGQGISISGVQSPTLSFNTSSTNNAARNWAFVTNYNTFGDLTLLYAPNNYSAAYGGTAALTILNNGNVGVGTTTPSDRFSIVGNLSSTTGAVFATTSGNVGIGVGAPAAKFHVNQTSGIGMTVESSDTTSTVLNIVSAGTTTQHVLLLRGNSGTTIGLDVDASGQVGIGTSTPDATLTVQNGTGNVLAFKDSGGTTRLQVYALHSNPFFYEVNATNYDLHLVSYSSGGSGGNITFLTNTAAGGVERMRIRGDGNVGIGTTSPARTVHINDTLRLQPRTSAPSTPSLGDLYVDSDTNTLCFYNSTAWAGINNAGPCT